MTTGKGKGKKGRVGSSLTDAVVAALAQVDDKPGAAKGSGEPAPVNGARHGFRSGPGSFADLSRRWAGGAPMTSEPPRASGPAPEPAPVEVEARAESLPAPEPPMVTSTEATIPGMPAALSPEGEPPASEASQAEASADETAERAADGPPSASDETPAAAEPAAAEPGSDKAGSDQPGSDRPAAEESAEPRAAEAGGPVLVSYYGRTDVGLVREHNEDNFLVADLAEGVRDPDKPSDATVGPAGCVFAVCDGMGGAAAGEVASQMAVDTVHEVMGGSPPAEDRDDFARRLVTAIEEAGQRIFSAAKMDRSRRGMGTTATVAGMVDNVLFVGQVGDSRAYVLRGDQFAQVTKDQSLVNQLIEAGQLTEEEAEAFEHSNIILQALGTTEEVTVDLTFLELREGDRLMLCSDGLSGLVHGDMMREVLQETEDKEAAAAKLIQMANAGGGHDNISVIVADFHGGGLSDDQSAPVRYQQYPLPPSDKRRQSLPPRAISMKPGATKPGADVKRDATGPSHDVELPPAGGGSNALLYAVMVLLLLVGAAGAWFLWGGSGAGDEGSDLPPPPDAPVADPTPVEEPLPEPPPAEPGTITITSDVEGGTLFINGEDRGPLEDGQQVTLAPGGYTLEVRVGETAISQQTVTVTEGAAIDVSLSVPVGAADDLPDTGGAGTEGDAPDQGTEAAGQQGGSGQGSSEQGSSGQGSSGQGSSGQGDTGRSTRRGSGRTGGRSTPGGNTPNNGPLPTNPF